MSRRWVWVLVVAACVLAAPPARAQFGGIQALDFTGAAGGFGIGGGTLGWLFQPSANLAVTELGVWDRDGNGLAQLHTVTIWGPGDVIAAQGTVTSGASTAGWRWTTPTTTGTLLQGQSYTIGAYYASTSDDAAMAVATLTTNGIAATPLARWGPGTGRPTNSDANTGLFGPTFKYTPAAPSQTPEPATLALLGVGLVGGALRRRKR